MPRYPTNPDEADILSLIIGRLNDLEMRDQTGPFCRLGAPSGTMATGAFQAFTWGDVEDPYGMVSGGVVTLPRRGWWRILGASGFAPAVGGTRLARLTVNGAAAMENGPHNMDAGGLLPIVDLIAGEEDDEIRLGGLQDSGGDLLASGGFLAVEWAHNRWD